MQMFSKNPNFDLKNRFWGGSEKVQFSQKKIALEQKIVNNYIKINKNQYKYIKLHLHIYNSIKIYTNL